MKKQEKKLGDHGDLGDFIFLGSRHFLPAGIKFMRNGMCTYVEVRFEKKLDSCH